MPPEPWCSKMQLGILKPLDIDESLSLTKVSLLLDLEVVSWSVFFHPDELKPSDCHRRTVLLVSRHLMSFVSKHELKLLDRYVKTIRKHFHLVTLTLCPPVLSLRGVRYGSKIMWLVSMSMGDCLFPMAHRFQAEFTRPQKDGTSVGTRGKKESNYCVSACACLCTCRHKIKP